jgi:hypothetical protein
MNVVAAATLSVVVWAAGRGTSGIADDAEALRQPWASGEVYQEVPSKSGPSADERVRGPARQLSDVDVVVDGDGDGDGDEFTGTAWSALR